MEIISTNKKRGRPSFKPTRRQRNTVEIAVAAGMSAAECAVALGISRPTLESHFATELKDGRTRKRSEVLSLLYRAAQRGSVSAAKFLLTVISDGQVVIGKKARRQQAAQEVIDGGSEWGDDLHPTTKLQ